MMTRLLAGRGAPSASVGLFAFVPGDQEGDVKWQLQRDELVLEGLQCSADREKTPRCFRRARACEVVM